MFRPIISWYVSYLLVCFAVVIKEIRTESLFLGQSAIFIGGQNVLFYFTYQQATLLFTKVVFNKYVLLGQNVKYIPNEFSDITERAYVPCQ